MQHFFNPNTEANAKMEVCQILNIMTKLLNEKYLSLPTMVGADKAECSQYMVDKVCVIIQGLKEKFLSYGWKGTLINQLLMLCHLCNDGIQNS